MAAGDILAKVGTDGLKQAGKRVAESDVGKKVGEAVVGAVGGVVTSLVTNSLTDTGKSVKKPVTKRRQERFAEQAARVKKGGKVSYDIPVDEKKRAVVWVNGTP